MDSNTLFSIVFILIIAAIGYFLVRGRQATDPDGELSILEYGELLLQADKTARIIVRGVQEEWRNGTIEDDQRTHEAVKQLKEIYPQIDDKELIRIVKSAVYLLRLGAGKQVDKVLESVPDDPKSIFEVTPNLGQIGVLKIQTGTEGGIRLDATRGGIQFADLNTNQPG